MVLKPEDVGCDWSSNLWVASESGCLTWLAAKQRFTTEQEDSIARVWCQLLSAGQRERFSLFVRVDAGRKRWGNDASDLRASGLFEVRRLSAAVVDLTGDCCQAEHKKILEKAEVAVGFELSRGDSLIVTSKKLEKDPT